MEPYGEVDIIWRRLHKWGKYQMFQMCLVLLDYLPACFAILSAVYTGYIPEYKCKDISWKYNSTNDSSLQYVDDCYIDIIDNNTGIVTERLECEHTYSNDHSYSSQWGLVCSRSNLAALAQSLVIGGQGIGALTMSHLADRFGRKKVHVLAHIGVMFSMLVMAFSTNIYMLLALRLVVGTFQQGIICTASVLLLEMFPKETRAYVDCLGLLAWSSGLIVLSVYGYVFKNIDWRYLQIGIVVFSLYSLVEWWLLEDSLRWLLINGKTEEAEKVLKKAARWNKVQFTNIQELYNEAKHLSDDPMEQNNVNTELVPMPKNEDSKKADKVEKYTIIDILKNPELRVDTLILWYAWIVAAGNYYGLTLVSSHLAGDRFINFALSGLVETPACFIGMYLYNKIGRKRTLIMWYALEGVSLIFATLLLFFFAHIHALTLVATGFSLIGKMAAAGTFSACFLYTPEIYPTNYRSSGLGIASSVSRIGGILSPFASNLALIAMWIPGAVFCGLCLLVAVLALRLPESMQHELPSTMKDRDKWQQED